MKYSEALDAKYAALALSRKMAPTFEAGNQYRTLFGRYERWALQNAEAFWWSNEIADAVSQSAGSLSRDALVSNDRLTNGRKCGWMWFEKPRMLSGEHEPFSGLLWFVDKFQDGKPAIAITTYGPRDSSAPEALDTMHLFDKRTLGQVEEESISAPDAEAAKTFSDFGIDAVRVGSLGGLIVRFFMAAQLWIQQSIVTVSSKPAERHTVKRVKKVVAEALTEVRVIELRRRQYEHIESGGATEPIDWSCRWIVSGHWRNQYHPSTGERVPMWIMPYVKGPEDKPLKTPSATVFAVTR